MNELLNNDYLEDLNRIKETIRENQNKAMVIVNSAMIMTYYEIGIIINTRKAWGNKYVQKLSEDLKEYGRGYSTRNLRFMAQLSSSFSNEEILKLPVSQLPWRSIITIMQRSSSHEEMVWYVKETFKHSWSKNALVIQFACKAYERNQVIPSTTDYVKSDDSLNEIFKDTYVFDFIDKDKIKSERDLTNNLIDNIVKFIQEMGSDFAFVGKEYKITTPTNKDYFIDILLYHLKLHCYVVLEIKSGKFNPGDLGQLLFYVNAINTLKKTDIDDDSIGLILCMDSDDFVVENTLKSINNRVGVSKYKYIEDLTIYLTEKLKNNNR